VLVVRLCLAKLIPPLYIGRAGFCQVFVCLLCCKKGKFWRVFQPMFRDDFCLRVTSEVRMNHAFGVFGV